jgi:hypothetical protein
LGVLPLIWDVNVEVGEEVQGVVEALLREEVVAMLDKAEAAVAHPAEV